MITLFLQNNNLFLFPHSWLKIPCFCDIILMKYYAVRIVTFRKGFIMSRDKNERFIILLISLACLGLTVESILAGWEFWVPPLIIIGTISLWFMNITGNPEYKIRKITYFIFAALTVFFHGIHETSFFDIALIISLVMIAYSFFDEVYMINIFLTEFVILIGIQLLLAYTNRSIEFDFMVISRIILHLSAVGLLYFCCVKSINDRAEKNVFEEDTLERID